MFMLFSFIQLISHYMIVNGEEIDQMKTVHKYGILACSCYSKIRKFLQTYYAWSHGRNYWLNCRFKASKNAWRRITTGKTSSSLLYSTYNLNNFINVPKPYKFYFRIFYKFWSHKWFELSFTAWPRVRKRADARGSETNPQKNVYVVLSERNTLYYCN